MSGNLRTSVSNSITIRLRLSHHHHALANLTACIGELHGNIGAIDIVEASSEYIIRDLTIDTAGEDHAAQIIEAIGNLEHAEIVNFSDRTFLLHLGGKIEVISKTPLKTRDQLSMAYTPGVAPYLRSHSRQAGRCLQADDQKKYGRDCQRWHRGTWSG